MAKKDFKNPALSFITTAEDEKQEAQEREAAAPPKAAADLPIPKGFRLVPEYKSERIQLLVRPATKKAIARAAASQGISMNELINSILEEFIERQG